MEIVERTVTYQVWDVDAWNGPEGWDINQVSVCGEIQCQEFGDDWEFNVSEIINALYNKELLTSNDYNLFVVEDFFDGVVVLNANNNEPLYILQEDK